MTRPRWDEYFMDCATAIARRSTCDRKSVGCVLVVDKQQISTGYNGSLRGAEHCDDVGHDLANNHCVRVVHAEANAICNAARRGISTVGATAYVTSLPCWPCFKMLAQAGIARIVYRDAYRSTEALRQFEAATHLQISLEQV